MRTIASLAVAAILSVPAASPGAQAPAAPSGDVGVPADHAIDLVLPDGVAVTLEPGTRGRWLPRTKLPSETNKWTAGYHLVLTEGEIEVRMPPGPRGSHAFLVATREGTLTDWRGKLHVSAHGDTAAAAIYEGALVVGSNGMGFAVTDGAGILMRKNVDPDKSRVIPVAPQWENDGKAPSFAVVPGGAPASLGFRWQPVQGAASYRVVVASDPAMSRVLEAATTTEARFDMVERAPTTRYWAQVRAVGPEGIVGEWSAPRPLRVVHYAVPEGAVVARDGALVLPAHASLSVSDADGVEVAYTTPTGRAGPVPLYWSKLGGALGMPNDPEVAVRVVHLRDPGVSGESTLVLARRQLRADIEVSPKNARAGDPIDVRALVWDPSGRVDGATEKVTLQAKLDIDPLPVAWQRTGNAWTARIPPPRVTGPTVIRVTATDAGGVELGRAFLELEGPPGSRR